MYSSYQDCGSCLFKQAHLLVCPVLLWRLSAPRIEAPCFLLSVTHWTSGWRNTQGLRQGSQWLVEITHFWQKKILLEPFYFPFPLAGLHFPAAKALKLLQVGLQVPGGWGGVAMEIDIFWVWGSRATPTDGWCVSYARHGPHPSNQVYIGSRPSCSLSTGFRFQPEVILLPEQELGKLVNSAKA